MLRNCALRVAWWWPLALAAFALSALAAFALGAGVAHADDGSTPAGNSQSQASSAAGAHRSAIASRRAARAVDHSADPGTTPVVRQFQSSRHVSIVRNRPTAKPVGAIEPVVTSTTTGSRHPKAAQFLRQVVGAASDIGVLGASLVNNVAADTAAAIGPRPFLGVPYKVATLVANTAGNVSKVLSGTPLDATSIGPFAVNYGVVNVLAFLNPTKAPAGADDPSITVTAAHPLPIILVNGTAETQGLNWSVGAPVLANAGYKVYTFNYGNPTSNPNFPIQSLNDIAASAAELSAEVDEVLEETGASQVILIGHSQGGGILPEYYINDLDGAAKVSQFIGLAASNHGSNLDGLVALQKIPILGPLLFGAVYLIGPALIQQTVTSPFQQVVYGDGDTRPGVVYTTIASNHDEVVTPYTQQALDGPNVTNIVLQDQDPGIIPGHEGTAFTQPAWADVLEALAANPQANPLQGQQVIAA